MNIIFFGNEKLASGSITKALIFSTLAKREEYNVVLLILPRPSSENLEVTKLANDFNITVVYQSNYSNEDFLEIIKKSNAEIGILASYGRIVKKDILDSLKYGIINLHPSDLPLYRGSTPIESAILNSDKTIGICIIELVEAMDEGPIISKGQLKIENLSKQEIVEEVELMGAEMMLGVLKSIKEGNLKKEYQDNNLATYTKKISKLDGLIDLNKPTRLIAAEIKAFYGWPGSFLAIDGSKISPVKIIEARLSKSGVTNKAKKVGLYSESSLLFLGFNNGDALEVLKIQPANKNAMDASDFVRGFMRV
jgi:methionyl-tRNA formyltransferase